MSNGQQHADFNERFHQQFQRQVKSLQEQIEQLPSTSPATTAGEKGATREKAVQQCLAGIAALSQEVSDAREHLPAYDQRTYANAVKALSEKLTSVRNQFAPRAKFSFKAAPKARKRPSVPAAAAVAAASSVSTDVRNETSTLTKSDAASASLSNSDEAGDNANDLIRKSSIKSDIVHIANFASARSITISNQEDAYITITPSSLARAGRAARILDVSNTIIDLRAKFQTPSAEPEPEQQQSHALAALTIKSATRSLLICGNVDGAVHITGAQDCVIAASCRQLRMHECERVSVYLHCASRPIIERSRQIGFAPSPLGLESSVDAGSAGKQKEGQMNRWNEVDDFNWLQQEASPNWFEIAPEERVPQSVWQSMVSPEAGKGLMSKTLTAFSIQLSSKRSQRQHITAP